MAAGALVRHSFFMRIFVEWYNEWTQVFQKCNWYTCTFIYIYFEYDKTRNGVECIVIILGLGFRICYSWDFENSEIGKFLKEEDEI